MSTPNPAAGQQRPGVPQELKRARGVQRDLGGCRLAERGVERGEQPGRGAEAGEQLLFRMTGALGQGTDQPAVPGPGPHVGGGQHQARVGGRLERELDPPVVAHRLRVPGRAPPLSLRLSLSSAYLSSAGISPRRLGGSTKRKQVRTEPPGSAELASQSVNSAASSHASRSSVPSVTSRSGCGPVRASSIRSATGIRPGAPTAARGQQRGGQPGADRCVGHGVQHVREQRTWRGARREVRAGAGQTGLASTGLANTVRQAAGMAAASSLACRASAADSTGRQRAQYPASSLVSTGTTRPRTARSAANRPTAAR